MDRNVAGFPAGKAPRHRGRKSRPLLALAAFVSTAVAGCSSGGAPATHQSGAGKGSSWVTTTPAANGQLASVRWNLLLEPGPLDPAVADNYGENTVLANLCESLMSQRPDFSVGPGLGTLKANADRTQLVYSIDPKARFWDGKPVTATDAAYSLMRAWKPANGQPAWTTYFDAVRTIKATGPEQVTVTLKHPDLLFEEIMSTGAGEVVERAATEASGGKIGSPNTPPMCSGPYKFVHWRPGADLTIERNENYWRGVTAKTKQITFTFLQGDAATTNALVAGAVQGMYNPPWSALQQLPQYGKLYDGRSLLTFYLIPTAKKGPLQDPRIRKALFLATDRAGVARVAFNRGAAPARTLLPRDSYGAVKPTASTGTGGSAAELKQAKALVAQAGSPKQPIILAGTPAISDSLVQSLQALAEAGQRIGLDVQYKSVTLDQFYGFFGGGNAWKAVNADGFGSQWNAPVADPMSMYTLWSDPKGFLNYGQFADSTATGLVQKAAGEADAATRAATLAQVDARLAGELPWIPVVDVANVLFLGKGITGAPASQTNWFSPWATGLGRIGS